MLIDATYRENGKKCRVTIAKEPVSLFTPACMALGKDGPYTTAINEQLIDNHLQHTIHFTIIFCLQNSSHSRGRTVGLFYEKVYGRLVYCIVCKLLVL